MKHSLKEFVAHLQQQDRSDHTVAAYRSDVAGFLAWLEKRLEKAVTPAEVTTFDVRRYRDHLVDRNRKPATVNRKLAALRVFFDWAMTEDQASTNPAATVKGPKHSRQPPKALTENEVYKLQRTAAEQRQLVELKSGQDRVTPSVVAARRDEALLNLLLYTGLRVGELAALKREDVMMSERKGTVIVRSGKGRRYREVPLHKVAREVLTAYLEVRPDDQGDALFLGQRGALGERGIQIRLKELGKAAEVKVTPHMLRHTFATRLFREAKTDLVTVADLLGHSSVATTAIYTQPSEADRVQAIERLK